MISLFQQALRMTARDWRAGELRFLMSAIIVAVSVLSAVNFFVDRMRTGLAEDAKTFMGADMIVRSDYPLPDIWKSKAKSYGLTIAETKTLMTMAYANDSSDALSKLVSLKAVSPLYPLKGQLGVSEGLTQPTQEVNASPSIGHVWIAPSLLAALDIRIGTTIYIGNAKFLVKKLLITEPDRGGGVLSFVPRMLISLDDLSKTQLVTSTSRMAHRLLLEGKESSLKDFQLWANQMMREGVSQGIRLESIETGNGSMRMTLARAESFLSLVGLLSAMLAALAIAMAARRFVLRHIDTYTMLRCLGLRSNQVTMLFVMEFGLVGLISSAIGVCIGFGAHYVLLNGLGSLVFDTLPPLTFSPVLVGLSTGLLLLIGFAIPPILQMRHVPLNQILRRASLDFKAKNIWIYGIGICAFFLLLLWQTRNLNLTLYVSFSTLVGIAVFGFFAWAGIQSLGLLQRLLSSPIWQFALRSMKRRPLSTSVQIVSLSLGLMALLLLTVISGDLISTWQKATPVNAPNHFVINIQTDQTKSIAHQFEKVLPEAPTLYPMIKGRLVKVNEHTVGSDQFSDDRAKRLIRREFNLSYTETMPPHNKMIAGKWYGNTQAEASVEEGLAKTLHLKIGDDLTFMVAGRLVTAKLTSLRVLKWSSMQVNFFVLMNPIALEEKPKSWITSFYLPSSEKDFVHSLVRAYPNLSIIDVSNLLKQLQTVLKKVTSAVEFLFLFTLASGILVLYAAFLSSQDERMREAALLRALGATKSQLQRAQWIELAMIGALSGILAATSASLIAWLLAHFVFEFNWVFKWEIWGIGVLLGEICAFLGGWLGLRNILNYAPIHTLRNTMT